MTDRAQQWDLIVVGGGAGGFFGAIQAAEQAPGLRVLILEGSAQTLSKVRISGGGRCNLTHACFDPLALSSHYPRGEKELLGPFHKFGPGDTLDWFERQGVIAKVEEDGRMFPVTDSAETVARCLEQRAEALGIELRLRQRVVGIHPFDGGFSLDISGGSTEECRQILLATGGQPAMWEQLSALGHHIVPPVPSLFTFKLAASSLHKLAGISVPSARLRHPVSGLESEGPLLITHEGLSGPAVLRLSAWGARDLYSEGYRGQIRVNWTGKPEIEWLEFLHDRRKQEAKRACGSRGQGDLPLRLWRWLLEESGISPEDRWADLSNAALNALLDHCTTSEHTLIGKSTFKEEFVTAGGVELSEVDLRRMESRLWPGLFFAGEVLNIDAVTGGFNFQAAWTGGWLAGSAVAKRYLSR